MFRHNPPNCDGHLDDRTQKDHRQMDSWDISKDQDWMELPLLGPDVPIVKDGTRTHARRITAIEGLKRL